MFQIFLPYLQPFFANLVRCVVQMPEPLLRGVYPALRGLYIIILALKLFVVFHHLFQLILEFLVKVVVPETVRILYDELPALPGVPINALL